MRLATGANREYRFACGNPLPNRMSSLPNLRFSEYHSNSLSRPGTGIAVAGEIYDVFVSYSRGLAAEIDPALRANGLSSFFPLTAACNPEPEVNTFDHFAEGGLPGTLELPIGRQGIV